MSLFLWSDTHFNHTGILTLGKGRPFKSVQEMNEELTRKWNARVSPKDTIFLLGDFAFAGNAFEPVEAIFAKLNGHKHLVTGNHDERNPKVTKLPWDTISQLTTIKHEKMRAEACHYPLESWKKAGSSLMLHGHCHGNLKRIIPHRFDVGVDVYPDGPVQLADLWIRAMAQEFRPSDHHGDQ